MAETKDTDKGFFVVEGPTGFTETTGPTGFTETTGPTGFTWTTNLDPDYVLLAHVRQDPGVDPPGTASGLTLISTKPGFGTDATFAEVIEKGGDVTRQFIGSLINDLVEERVERRLRPMKLEIARLKTKLKEPRLHLEELEEMRLRLEELEEGRILRFRLPVGYLDEEPEEM